MKCTAAGRWHDSNALKQTAKFRGIRMVFSGKETPGTHEIPREKGLEEENKQRMKIPNHNSFFSPEKNAKRNEKNYSQNRNNNPEKLTFFHFYADK